jgi:Core-2/I-Branching enzyme.
MLLDSANDSKVLISHNESIYWGDYSQINAEIKLFELANKYGPYSYYHLISGQDLPIQDQDYIHDFFDRNPNKIFLTIASIDTFNKNKINRRVKYNYKFIKYYSHSNPHQLMRLFFKLLERINFFYQDLNGSAAKRFKSLPKIGYASNWVSLNEDAVNYILNKQADIYKIFKIHICAMNFLSQLCYSIFKNIEICFFTNHRVTTNPMNFKEILGT